MDVLALVRTKDSDEVKPQQLYFLVRFFRPRARQVATYHVTDHDLLCGGGVTPTYSPSKMRCPPGHCNKLLQRNTS